MLSESLHTKAKTIQCESSFDSNHPKHSSGFYLPNNRTQTAIQRKEDSYLINNRPQAETPLQFQKNNTGLPDNLKSGIENLSGYSMNDVKVHYNSSQPAQLNAHAYAQGSNIHIAPGQEKHLPHEAWHVVQQKQGRVKPTMQMKGKVNVNDDKGLEKEADVMGARAISVENNSEIKNLTQRKSNANTYQLFPWGKSALAAIGAIGTAVSSSAGTAVSGALGLTGTLASVATFGVPLAIGTGAAGLAYAGYKGYHAYRRYSTHHAVQQELSQYDPANNPNVNLNVGAHPRSQLALIPNAGALPGAPAGPLANRRYRIDINQGNPTGEGMTDPDMIASAITHEKTHIANDQSYDENLGRLNNAAPVNLTTAEMGAINGPAVTDPTEIILHRVQQLQQTAQNDPQVPQQWRQYIINRLDYIIQGMNPMLEYDTVINELLHFLYAKNIAADSETVQEITTMAKENHERRTQ